MRIVLPIMPPRTTAQQKGVRVVQGRPQFYTKQKVARGAATWMAALAPYRPKTPLEGPIRVSAVFIYPYLTSTPQKARGGLLPKATKSDVENTFKQLGDVLTSLQFFRDDAQIVVLHLEKWHGPEAKVVLTLDPLTME